MTNRYWFWWIPGCLAFPFLAIGPSTGWPVLIFALIMLILVRTWVTRTFYRVNYINAQIDRGVVFSNKATFLDQTVSRRKRMVLNYDNVKVYAGSTQKLCFTMMILVLFVIIYSNFTWFKNPTISYGMFAFFTKSMVKTGAIITSMVAAVLLMLSCFFAFLSCRHSAGQLKDENAPKNQTPEEVKAEKEESIEAARDSAKKSGGMIANLAHKTVSEESEKQAYKKAEQAGKSGSIAAKARIDVSDDGNRMSLDERIEAEHLAREAEKVEKAEAEAAKADAEATED